MMAAAHGTNNRYVHPKIQCRCDACREAHTAYQRQYRADQRTATTTEQTPAQNGPPQATREPQTQPELIPHIWVQNAIPNAPPVFAGQVMTSDGRQAGYQRGPGVGWLPLPVRFAPRTQEGLDQLGELLCDDLDRAKRGAA